MLKKILDYKKILIIQADNPDGDSLGSALALEAILTDGGSEAKLYCGVDIPDYLHYIKGWERTRKEVPADFDASVIIDCNTETLLEKIKEDVRFDFVQSRPCYVIDHHATTDGIKFATEAIVDADAVSTTLLIFQIAKEENLTVSAVAGEALLAGLLSDSQGLSTENCGPAAYRVAADLLELGVNRAELEERRQAASNYSPKILHYKGMLLQRVELLMPNNLLALLTFDEAELHEYSPHYNPSALVQADMLRTEGVGVTVCIKVYLGRCTGSIRCRYGYPYAGKLAERLGGGGHDYAAGFKLIGADVPPLDVLKENIIQILQEIMPS
jgi:bifunctional oligoribonuclease and PAP phosphatase NrnA